MPVIHDTGSDSNLAPVIRKDGSLIGLWRSFSGHRESIPWNYSHIHMVTASDWKDPRTYEYGSSQEWRAGDVFNSQNGGPMKGPTEDPFGKPSESRALSILA